VILLVIENRNAKRVSLGFKVKETEWNPEKEQVRRNHPQHEELNKIIKEAKAKELAGGREVPKKTLLEDIFENQKEEHRVQAEANARGEFPVPEGLDDEAKEFLEELNTAGRRVKRQHDEMEAMEKQKEKLWADHLKQVNRPPNQGAPGLLETFDEHIKTLKREKSIGTASNYQSTRNKVAAFTGREDIMVSDIDIKWVKSFDAYMANEELTLSSRYKHHKSVRKLLHDMVREDIILTNPYKKIKLKQDTAEKQFLSAEQFEQLRAIELKHLQHVARQMYCFSLYAGGLRIRDTVCLRYKHLKKNFTRLELRQVKTGGDLAFDLPSPAVAILQEFVKEGAKPDDFVFPLLHRPEDKTLPADKFYKRVSACCSLLNKNLRAVSKKLNLHFSLNYHSSRHSFAVQAINSGKIRLEVIQKAMGHSRIQQTQQYAKLNDKTVSEELGNLFN